MENGWRRASAARAVCMAVAGLAVASLAAASGAPDMEAALQRLDVPEALRLYDAGPASLDLLGRIARADLLYCLSEGKLWDRLESARVLAELGEDTGRQGLLDALRSDQGAIRTRAAELAAEGSLAEAVPLVEAIAVDPQRSPFERLRAARALHRLGRRTSALEVAAELSRSSDLVARRQAAAALDAFADPQAHTALRALLADEDLQVRITAAKGLLTLGEESGRAALRQVLTIDNPAAQLEAALFLGLAGDRSGLEVARRLTEQGLGTGALDNTVHYAPEMAAYILSYLDPEIGRPYLSRMAAMENISARLAAARRLAELGDPAALPLLSDLSRFQPDSANAAPHRADAVRFAGWLGDGPGVRDLARQALADMHPQVRLEGMTVLARLGDPAALGPLRGLLGDPALRPRALAAELVLEFGIGPPPPVPLDRPIGEGPGGR